MIYLYLFYLSIFLHTHTHTPMVEALVRQALVPVRELKATTLPVQRPDGFLVRVLVPLTPALLREHAANYRRHPRL